MIINKQHYFTNELYLPESKRSITNSASEQSSLDWFIPKYVKDCLFKSLGSSLYREFEQNLDSDEENGLVSDANEKWDRLLNGREYTDHSGNLKSWRGIRFKNIDGESNYDRSFLANYVYFFYERNDSITRSRIGNVEELAKNATLVSNYPKLTHAWNEFVDMVQGKNYFPVELRVPDFYLQHGDSIISVDYYNEEQEVSMYEFIRDVNKIEPNTYEKFKPKCWDRINQFDL